MRLFNIDFLAFFKTISTDLRRIWRNNSYLVGDG